tara:strand:+ start:249 stop:1178 length:930 start_codon:yes stop_codon:yes gene_type:complete
MHKTDLITSKNLLKKGKLVIFPTETVFGLGGDATNTKVVTKIYKLKKRPKANPIICHFKNITDIRNNFEINKLEFKLAKKFWPGPLTLILKKKKNSKISPILSNKGPFVGCRIPNNKVALSLLKSVNFPIAAPSANIATKSSVTYSKDIDNYLRKKVYILKGRSRLGLESTVIQVKREKIHILRLGSITDDEIKKKFKKTKVIKTNFNKLSPGNQKKHYATNLSLRINVKKVKDNEVLLNFGKNKLSSKILSLNLSKSGDLKEASKNFFHYLNILDKSKSYGIAVAKIPSIGLGKTMNDRLKRASFKKN